MTEETFDSYTKYVESFEGQLASYAKKSFEAESQVFVDGTSVFKHFSDLWQDNPGRIANRTPVQLERDRILYSNPMRKETEKYHILYNGQRRIVRNYATHSMRMTQVARSICNTLRLNPDFAEAIALGAKVGAVPFVHAAKQELTSWAMTMIDRIDKEHAANEPQSKPRDAQIQIPLEASSLPTWLSAIQSSRVRNWVMEYIPWAAGKSTGNLYSSGQESYWVLSTNPYTVESLPKRYSPETMLGIWRHTRGLLPGPDSFYHEMKLNPIEGDATVVHRITHEHSTYESVVVQYSDDITWVIENLNDANAAALLNGQISVYSKLKDHLRSSAGGMPDALLRALDTNNAGGLYTYFIDDFIRHSRPVLTAVLVDDIGREQLVAGDECALIGLSPTAQAMMAAMCKFLDKVVFEEARVRNRKEMLKRVIRACAELMYEGGKEALPRIVAEKNTLDQWTDDQLKYAMSILDNPIHRIQITLDTLAEMGDQEIYDFVGIQSL